MHNRAGTTSSYHVWVKSRAAQQVAAGRLLRETAEAFGRYQSALEQVERFDGVIVPALRESADLLRRGYQIGGVPVTFTDMFLAAQSLAEARLRRAEARRELEEAIADLQGLMQIPIEKRVENVAPTRRGVPPVP